MKKVVILLAIVSLLAAPAFAGIRNSKHDLSNTSGTSYFSDNETELCVFCHTPHGGLVGGFAPLWNRSGAELSLTVDDLYNSATLQVGISNPTEVRDAVNLSDAKLCLTCHDGGSLANGLLNPSVNGQPQFASSDRDAVSGTANLYDGTLGGTSNGTAMLTNDHPIGMTYDSNLDGGSGLEFIVGSVAGFADDNSKLPLYTLSGSYSNVMWCSTCHDVHNSTNGTPFLNTTNAGSALCLTCHNK